MRRGMVDGGDGTSLSENSVALLGLIFTRLLALFMMWATRTIHI